MDNREVGVGNCGLNSSSSGQESVAIPVKAVINFHVPYER
jgi:hypothetical protein